MARPKPALTLSDDEKQKFATWASRSKRAQRLAHVVLDNDAAHKGPAVKRWLWRHPEDHLRVIPTSRSWLSSNQLAPARCSVRTR